MKGTFEISDMPSQATHPWSRLQQQDVLIQLLCLKIARVSTDEGMNQAKKSIKRYEHAPLPYLSNFTISLLWSRFSRASFFSYPASNQTDQRSNLMQWGAVAAGTWCRCEGKTNMMTVAALLVMNGHVIDPVATVVGATSKFSRVLLGGFEVGKHCPLKTFHQLKSGLPGWKTNFVFFRNNQGISRLCQFSKSWRCCPTEKEPCLRIRSCQASDLSGRGAKELAIAYQHDRVLKALQKWTYMEIKYCWCFPYKHCIALSLLEGSAKSSSLKWSSIGWTKIWVRPSKQNIK